MRHPPELLIYIVPLAILSGLAVAIAQETGNVVAWGAAGVAGCLLVYLCLRSLGFAWHAARAHAAERRSDVTKIPLKPARKGMGAPIGNKPALVLNLFGNLDPDHLMEEASTAFNVHRYLR